MSAPLSFRWECWCSTCRWECNTYVRSVLAEALFGWLRTAERRHERRALAKQMMGRVLRPHPEKQS